MAITQSKKVLYSNNKKIKSFNQKKSDMKALFDDDTLLKGNNIDDLLSLNINDTIKLLKKIIVLQNLKLKLEANGVISEPEPESDVEPEGNIVSTKIRGIEFYTDKKYGKYYTIYESQSIDDLNHVGDYIWQGGRRHSVWKDNIYISDCGVHGFIINENIDINQLKKDRKIYKIKMLEDEDKTYYNTLIDNIDYYIRDYKIQSDYAKSKLENKAKLEQAKQETEELRQKLKQKQDLEELKTIYNINSRKTKLMRFKYEVKVKFIDVVKASHPEFSDEVIIMLYNDIDISKFEPKEKEYISMERQIPIVQPTQPDVSELKKKIEEYRIKIDKLNTFMNENELPIKRLHHLDNRINSFKKKIARNESLINNMKIENIATIEIPSSITNRKDKAIYQRLIDNHYEIEVSIIESEPEKKNKFERILDDIKTQMANLAN